MWFELPFDGGEFRRQPTEQFSQLVLQAGRRQMPAAFGSTPQAAQ